MKSVVLVMALFVSIAIAAPASASPTPTVVMSSTSPVVTPTPTSAPYAGNGPNIGIWSTQDTVQSGSYSYTGVRLVTVLSGAQPTGVSGTYGVGALALVAGLLAL